MKRRILFSLMLLGTTFGRAQEVQLVKDIFPGGSSYPSSFCPYKGKLFFGARSALGADGFWQSDGTDSGTISITDKDGNLVSASSLYVYKDKLYFSGGNSQYGPELWVSDGTSSGTYILKDIIPGNTGSNPTYFTESGGLLFFTIRLAQFSHQLWRTDGTEAGTIQVKDINPGNQSNITYLIDLNGRLFFEAEHQDYGREIWVSDGTDAGTHLFADLDPGPQKSGGFFSPFVFKNRLYFSSAGQNLWVSDGTVAGTYRAQDSMLAPQDIKTPIWYAVLNDKMYFVALNMTAGKELWVSDGTDTGTKLLVETVAGYSGSDPNFLTQAGKFIFFMNLSPDYGRELWLTDGTAEGTRLLKDINPGTLSSNPRRLTGFGGKVYFTAQDGSNGEELWVSDGTDTGTKKIKPPFATASGPLGFSIDFVSIDTTLFFSAGFDEKGYELYKISIRKPAPNSLYTPDYEELIAFPNPFTGKVFLSSRLPLGGESIFMSDYLGREWPLQDIVIGDDGLVEINVSENVPRGVYYLFIPELTRPVKLIKR